MINSIKRHIALFAVIVLCIPTLIQLIHVFENHEHVSCTSKDVQHIHDKGIDCDIFHRPYQNLSLDVPSQVKGIPTHYYITSFTELSQMLSSVYHSKKKSRGPPVIVI